MRQEDENLTTWLDYAAEGLQQTLERVWRRIQEIPAVRRAKLVLRPKQEKLLQLLRAHGGLSSQEIWDGLGVSKQVAMDLLRPLMKACLVNLETGVGRRFATTSQTSNQLRRQWLSPDG